MERRPRVRAIGLRVLWRVPKPALAAFAAPLCRYAVGADAAVRRAALTALDGVATSALSPHAHRFVTALGSCDPGQRDGALAALRLLATAERLPLVPAIAARLSHPVAGVRGAALDALADAAARRRRRRARRDARRLARRRRLRRPPLRPRRARRARRRRRARRGRGVGASPAIVSATLRARQLRDDAHWRVREAAHPLAVLEAPPSASAAATPVPPIVASQPTGSTDDLMCGDDAGDDDASQLSEATSTASSPAPQASGSQKQRRRPSPAVPASASGGGGKRRRESSAPTASPRPKASKRDAADAPSSDAGPSRVDARLVARPLSE